MSQAFDVAIEELKETETPGAGYKEGLKSGSAPCVTDWRYKGSQSPVSCLIMVSKLV
jgi:hypothetical protein